MKNKNLCYVIIFFSLLIVLILIDIFYKNALLTILIISLILIIVANKIFAHKSAETTKSSKWDIKPKGHISDRITKPKFTITQSNSIGAADIKQYNEINKNQAGNENDEVRVFIKAIDDRNFKSAKKIIQSNPDIVNSKVEGKSIIIIALEVCIMDIGVVKKDSKYTFKHIYKLRESVKILEYVYVTIKRNNFIIEQQDIKYIQNKVIESEIDIEYSNKKPIDGIIMCGKEYIKEYHRKYKSINKVNHKISFYDELDTINDSLSVKKHKDNSIEKRKRVHE